MSGGHYDYAFGKVGQLARDIRSDVTLNSTERKDGWTGQVIEPMPKDVLLHMEHVAGLLEELADAAHDIEWLMSWDYGYDTLRRCKSWSISEAARAREALAPSPEELGETPLFGEV